MGLAMEQLPKNRIGLIEEEEELSGLIAAQCKTPKAEVAQCSVLNATRLSSTVYLAMSRKMHSSPGPLNN